MECVRWMIFFMYNRCGVLINSGFMMFIDRCLVVDCKVMTIDWRMMLLMHNCCRVLIYCLMMDRCMVLLMHNCSWVLIDCLMMDRCMVLFMNNCSWVLIDSCMMLVNRCVVLFMNNSCRMLIYDLMGLSMKTWFVVSTNWSNNMATDLFICWMVIVVYLYPVVISFRKNFLMNNMMNRSSNIEA